MKRTLSFLLPAAAMLLAACGGANDRPSFPDFQEMADPEMGQPQIFTVPEMQHRGIRVFGDDFRGDLP